MTIGRPRDARLDQAILDAAREILASQGYRGMTFPAVAERAGTSTPSIYRRWSSKPDLVLDAVFGTTGDEVVAETGDLRTDLHSMVRWSLDKLGGPLGRAALAGMLSEASTEPARLDQLARLWSRLGGFLEHHHEALRGDLSPTEFVTMLVGPAIVAGSILGRANSEVAAERITELVLTGISQSTRRTSARHQHS